MFHVPGIIYNAKAISIEGLGTSIGEAVPISWMSLDHRMLEWRTLQNSRSGTRTSECVMCYQALVMWPHTLDPEKLWCLRVVNQFKLPTHSMLHIKLESLPLRRF